MNLHSWGGRYFGTRDGDNLWTHDGRHVGRFREDEVFDSNGRYLGEIENGKLITNTLKSSLSGPSFTPHASRVGHVQIMGHVELAMIMGHKDFPNPDEL